MKAVNLLYMYSLLVYLLIVATHGRDLGEDLSDDEGVGSYMKAVNLLYMYSLLVYLLIVATHGEFVRGFGDDFVQEERGSDAKLLTKQICK
uniref:Uncharacterized protein n=1 Tax=Oryza meridionalis TaxID=40149 RepID=A0A0E0E6W9_9ORYZ